MNKKLALAFWLSLLYVEYRWGLTLNRVFVVAFLILAFVCTCYAIQLLFFELIRFKSSKLLRHPLKYYRRKLLKWVMLASVAFYGFYWSQVPGQLAYFKTIIEREFEELTGKDDSSAIEDDSYSRPLGGRREKLVSETALAASKVDERQVDSKKIHQEITAGWNTSTGDTENDNVNWEKATDLMKKYPNYISNARVHNISAAKALEEPWEYYGKVVHFKGQIYAVEQLPPEDSVAQFFDGSCYHAMVAVKDKKAPVMVSAYIVGNADNVAENSVVNVRGFIYGNSTLINNMGGISKGIAFIGFHE